jgi:hypothetical protein
MQKSKALLPLLLVVSILVFAIIPQTMATLPNGNGVQKINEHIHSNEPYFFTRGYYYVPWVPEVFSGQIKVGAWLTIGFGWGDIVHESELEQRIAAEIAFLEAWELTLFFDGEEIDITDCWRFDDIIYEDWGDGIIFYYIPFRYYIAPRAVGHYDIVFVIDNPHPIPDVIFEGFVEWVPLNWL